MAQNSLCHMAAASHPEWFRWIQRRCSRWEEGKEQRKNSAKLLRTPQPIYRIKITFTFTWTCLLTGFLRWVKEEGSFARQGKLPGSYWRNEAGWFSKFPQQTRSVDRLFQMRFKFLDISQAFKFLRWTVDLAGIFFASLRNQTNGDKLDQWRRENMRYNSCGRRNKDFWWLKIRKHCFWNAFLEEYVPLFATWTPLFFRFNHFWFFRRCWESFHRCGSCWEVESSTLK